MNIDMKDRITLDDGNEYVVVSKINYQNINYYYLVDMNQNSNIKFCYENNSNNSLIESDDKILNQTLLPLFVEAAKDIVQNISIAE